jgi:hypothetical protein
MHLHRGIFVAKSSDPFIAGLWDALIEAKLSPAGHETPWNETATRTRNRFAKAVRQAMQSGAAFGAIPPGKIPVYATRAIKESAAQPKPAKAKAKKPRR